MAEPVKRVAVDAPVSLSQATYTIKQEVDDEEQAKMVVDREDDIAMEVDVPSQASFPIPRNLLCPPEELAECIFLDAFVFHPQSQVITSPAAPAHGPSSTVDYVFQSFCNLGLYSPTEKRWTSLAKVPEFMAENSKDTESKIAKFLNTLVSRAVEVAGIRPSVQRE